MVDSINVSDSLNIRKTEEPVEGQQTGYVSYRRNDYERTPNADTVSFQGNEDNTKKNNTGKTIALVTTALAIGSAIYAGIHGKNILEKAGKETGLIDSLKTGYKNFLKKAEKSDLVIEAEKATKEAKAKAVKEAEAEAKQRAEKIVKEQTITPKAKDLEFTGVIKDEGNTITVENGKVTRAFNGKEDWDFAKTEEQSYVEHVKSEIEAEKLARQHSYVPEEHHANKSAEESAKAFIAESETLLDKARNLLGRVKNKSKVNKQS